MATSFSYFFCLFVLRRDDDIFLTITTDNNTNKTKKTNQ